MSSKIQSTNQDFRAQAEAAAAQGDFQVAAELYAQEVEQRASALALINSVQEGLSSKLDMQSIYDLVGDMLRDTFNAQVVMISQYDPLTRRVFHHYAIERGRHLHIQDWQPLDSSRGEIIRSGKPFMINLAEIQRVVGAGMMHVVPGTDLPKTWMGVPMLVGDRAVGIVSLQNLDKENAFSQADIDLLTTLTNSMTLSLENARLFDATQRLLKQMEDEMKIARQTQCSILPSRPPRCAGYEFGSLIEPARSVGGDFYDFIHLDHNRRSLIIGDVSDKGLPAALIMALTFSLLRAETERSDDPQQILRNVNRSLLKMNASGMFVTLLYGILDCTTGVFSYTRAGHLPPIVVGPDGTALTIRRNTGQPLGLFDEVQLDIQEATIPPGGVALLFSDGLSETANPQGDEFGVERIRHELSVHRNLSARMICKKLWEAVKAFNPETDHQDDFVTVVVKRLET